MNLGELICEGNVRVACRMRFESFRPIKMALGFVFLWREEEDGKEAEEQPFSIGFTT